MLTSVRKFLTSPGGVLLVALGLRVVVAMLTTGAAYDIDSYHLQAASVFQHRNVYLFTDRYPYPPVWVWVVALVQWFANLTAIPFVFLVKVPAIAGDCLIVALLQRYKSNAAARFYALNPVSILITAGHGQFDGLVFALVVLAWVCWQAEGRARGYWAALALGGAIALKGYPILFLPALLIHISPNKQRYIAAGLALLPLALAFLVYGALFGFVGAMLTHVLGYSSSPYFGWSFLPALVLNSIEPSTVPLVLTPVGYVARAALVAFACYLPWRHSDWPVERLWLVMLLAFYALAPGVSAQYLLWALPFFALVDLTLGWRYTAFSTLAAVFYYFTTLNPGVLPLGASFAALAPQLVWLGCYVAANLGWWLVCTRVFLRVLRWSAVLPPAPQLASVPSGGGEDDEGVG
ncbi:MAG TPA: glycosyltransferase 87 family protein [Ktedonobacterales bacterium]